MLLKARFKILTNLFCGPNCSSVYNTVVILILITLFSGNKCQLLLNSLCVVYNTALNNTLNHNADANKKFIFYINSNLII